MPNSDYWRAKGKFWFVLTVVVAAVGAALIIFLQSVAQTWERVPVEIHETREALVQETSAVRSDLNQQISAIRADLLGDRGQVAGLRRDLVGRVDRITDMADARLASIQDRLDVRLGEAVHVADSRLSGAQGAIDGVRSDLRPALDSLVGITHQVDESLPMYLDCDHNVDCIFNRYVGVSRGVERAAINLGKASTDFSNALPGAITTWQGIGTNAAGITDNLHRLTTPKWYDRLIGYGLNGVVIYRNMNPASLTVKGAQIISSRP